MNKPYTYLSVLAILSILKPTNSLIVKQFHPLKTIRSLINLSSIWLKMLSGMVLYACTFSVSAQVNVLMHHNNPQRNGVNYRETKLNPSNVNVKSFGKVGSFAVDDQVYAQPLVFTHVPIKNHGMKDILIVCTVNNSVYAFDADAPGSTPLWHVNFNGPNVRAPRNTDMTGACGGVYTDFTGNIGIVSTPAIDSANFTMFCLSRTKEFERDYRQRLHALSLYDGSEKQGSPVLINASIKGNGWGSGNGILPFEPWRHNQRAALTIFKGNVYIAWASHCDWAPYHGWVMGYDIHTLEQKIIYNASSEGYAAGIWMAGAGFTYDEDHLYVTTGNGSVGVGANTGDTRNRGESALKLTPTGNTLRVDSWFTPYNYDILEELDQDLGSSGPVLLSGTNLMAFAGKEGKMYVIDKDSMGGLTGAGNDEQIVQSFYVNYNHHIHGTPVFWRGDQGAYLYVWGEEDHLKMYALNEETKQFDSIPFHKSLFPVPNGMPGAMLSLSSNGAATNTGILWASHPYSGDANHATRPGVLRAFDANNVTKELWNSQLNEGRDSVGNFAKFNCPTVANGKVYLATFSNKIDVYGGLSENPEDTIPPEVALPHGLEYQYYEGVFDSIPDFDAMFPVKKGTTANVGIEKRDRENDFAFSFRGLIKITQPGVYTFYLSSDDGSQVYLNDTLIVNNNGRHPVREREGKTTLTKGYLPIQVDYFQRGGGKQVLLSYSGPGFTKQPVSDSTLFRNENAEELREGILGVNYAYYEGSFDSIPNFSEMLPVKQGSLGNISLSPKKQEDYFAFEYTGFLKIPFSGNYTFYTRSDDGSTLTIGNKLVVANNGLHGPQERTGNIMLAAGFYPYTLAYFEKNGDEELIWSFKSPVISKQPVPDYLLFTTLPASDTNQAAYTYQKEGLFYSYYEGVWTSLPDFRNLLPVKTGVVYDFDLSPALRKENYGMQFNGFITVPANGFYTFYTSSDDGSNLYVDNHQIVNNDGSHGLEEQSGSIYLAPGSHAISVDYFQHTGDQNLYISYQGPAIPKQLVPKQALEKTYDSFQRLGEEAGSATTFSYAPNPTDGLLSIQYTSPGNSEMVIQVLNQLSSVVLDKSVHVNAGNNLISINLRELEGGIYQLVCLGDQKKFTGKVVLVK